MGDQSNSEKNPDAAQCSEPNASENMAKTSVGVVKDSSVTEEKQKNAKTSDKKSENKNKHKNDTNKHSSSKENGRNNSKPTLDKVNEKKEDDSQQKDKKNTEDKKDRKRDKSQSKSKTTRGKSRTPSRSSVSRSERYETSVRGHPSRRSPRRGRSRTPVRRRTRSPVSRRSPPLRYHREPRRWSPRRRSRSPRNRRSPGQTAENASDPKVLRAKKKFLDELAVQFAREGKEFPELEEYRCAINKQFVAYPIGGRFSNYAMEQQFAVAPTMPPMFTNAPQMEMHGNNAVVLTDPYNAYSYSYPGSMPNDVLVNSHAALEPVMVQQPLPQIQQMPESSPMEQNLVSDSGSHSFYSSDKADKSKVLIRITQAVQILDDLDQSISRSARFMYRAPTMYKNAHQYRSPMCSLMNPAFMFTNQLGRNTDPFANVPRKLKFLTRKLGLDEGVISEQIFKRQLIANSRYYRPEGQDNKIGQQMVTIPKPPPIRQKTPQSSPSACLECVRRKAQLKNSDTKQPNAVRTINSAVQTDPMAVQTVTEFGSITELTPNQVRAVSELIRYIKLTGTTGSLQEMRDSMREDQVYNLNSDLRSAYQYFDEMVEQKNDNIDMPSPINERDQPLVDTADTFKEVDCDGNSIDEYEEYHRNFCGSDEDDMSEPTGLRGSSNQHQYMYNDSTNSKYSGSRRNQQGSYGFGDNAGGVGSGAQYRSNDGRIPANNREGQRTGHGSGNFGPSGIQPNIYNRRN